MNEQRIKPSRIYYLLAAGIVVLGGGISACSLIAVFAHVLQPGQSVIVPGEGDVQLEQAGRYTVCYEYRSVIGGTIRCTPEDPPPLQCALTSQSNGREIPVKPLDMGYRYTRGASEGVGVWSFNIDKPGNYKLVARYPQGVEGPEEVVLTVVKGFPWRRVFWFVISVPLVIACFGAGVVIFIVTLVRRSASKGFSHRERIAVPPPPPH